MRLEALDLEEFDKYLGQVFGEGAKVLQRIILKRLYAETELEFEERKNWKFPDYVRFAEKQ